MGDGKFTATGNDPIFEIKNLPDGLILKVSVEVKASDGHMIEIYWAYEDEEAYSNRSVQKLKHGTLDTYNFALYLENPVKKLRIDPTNDSGKIEINKVRIFYFPHSLDGVSDNTYDIVKYIIRVQTLCERYLSPLCDPRNKSVLVIGSGYGTEMLWCIENGAKEVIGIDIAERGIDALKIAIKQMGIHSECHYEMLKMSAEEVEKLGRKFDIILSNNVFEHLPDVKRTLKACKKLIEPYKGRIAIFADPLFYSSKGAHIYSLEPWEHLWNSQIKSKTNANLWRQYSGLNRMKLSDFINSIENNDLAILQLKIEPDRNIGKLKDYYNLMDDSHSITNLTIEGISAELMRIDF